MTGIVARSIDGPVVVVRAPGQELPELDPARRFESPWERWAEVGEGEHREGD